MPRTRRSDPSGPGYAGRAAAAASPTATRPATRSRTRPSSSASRLSSSLLRGRTSGSALTSAAIFRPSERTTAGRRQYLYHDDWRAHRDRAKFKRLPEFAAKLPNARKALEADLALEGLVRERVMACAVRLLDIGMFRVGGEDYAEENESYGLATIQKQHVRVKRRYGDRVRLHREGRGAAQLPDRGPARRPNGQGAQAQARQAD